MITNSQRKLTPKLDAAIAESVKLINQYIHPDQSFCLNLYTNRLIQIFKNAGYIYNNSIRDKIIPYIKFDGAISNPQKTL